MIVTIQSAVSTFGAAAKKKLSNPAATGEPEDQLRAPFEQFLLDMAEVTGLRRKAVVPVGESSISDLKTRPDYAVSVDNALVGFVELKAPGKGADPRKFKDKHDRAQWERLRSLPNVLYSDGNGFSLWQNGELVESVVRFSSAIEIAGDQLVVPVGLLAIFDAFLRWEPIPPRSARELAHVSARLCRFLRDEVTEQLDLGSEALTALAEDWRKLLFPDASNERFADGYAQAVTFGLLMARAKDISVSHKGLQEVGSELAKSNSLIGSALRLLTDNAENQATLKTSLETLRRVLDAVNWPKISKGDPDAWLYFYEDFLEVYDNQLRKQTGSYYTPPQVVTTMVRLVDDVLRTDRYQLQMGLAAPTVTLADPAVGTGTFLLGVLRKIAAAVESEEGAGSVGGAVNAALKRLIAFEIQLGPFAVAQLRLLAEIVELTGATPKQSVRMFVTDTLGNPDDDEGYLPLIVQAIAKSRKDANKIKRDEPITVVLGNPPYKEKAKGRGGWIEGQTKTASKTAPLAAWLPPPSWGISTHSKHLRNLYVYFWRWATWKVFDHGPGSQTGIVCFITVAGFLKGPGFQKMRDYLRRTCDDIWVVDCSPDGHQPEVNTRIFQGVQQEICIVLASRSAANAMSSPATVRYHALPKGHRDEKFKALAALRLTGDWIDCPSDWRAPFLPAATGSWSTYPALDHLFIYDGSGVMPGRTWVIAPDAESLERRWQALLHAPKEQTETLFHPHLAGKKLGDRHSQRVISEGLPGYPPRLKPVAQESGPPVPPVQYGFRSFDRQWIIPDNRLINRPNPELWKVRSGKQIFLTAPADQSPSNGPALTFTALIPDLHHYSGRGGRIFPLWRDKVGQSANMSPKMLAYLGERLSRQVTAEECLCYIAAIAAHPAFTERFQADLVTPGLRIPITAERATFDEAVSIGRRVIWLHTFGERMVDPKDGRPPQAPRLPNSSRPTIPAAGAISDDPVLMPHEIDYNPQTRRLLLGGGAFVDNVDLATWQYEVSGKQVLSQWFSYRKKGRERPIMGDRRKPSPLGDIQPDHWIAEYTTELLNLLNVLGLLVQLEPQQAALLEHVCSGLTISEFDLRAAKALSEEAVKKLDSTVTVNGALFAE